MSIEKVIGNYRILRPIGDGGMGSVWLAEHTLLGRQVAVKALHPQFAKNEAIRARFKLEASTLAHLQHPGIVALHDYIEQVVDGVEGAYLVMEYVEGMPLDDYIRDVTGPIPQPLLYQLFGQILEAFIYAHGQKVVHRDIKPGNFLVTKDGRVKVLDFGIAKILGESDRKLTRAGTHMGTVLYMSPEQVRGQEVDQRSDIYSLGVTLFQMATGQNPYSADLTEFYVYDQIVNHPLPPASEFYPGVSAEVEAVIAKATMKDAEERFQDCGAFLKAVKGDLRGLEMREKERGTGKQEGGQAKPQEDQSAENASSASASPESVGTPEIQAPAEEPNELPTDKPQETSPASAVVENGGTVSNVTETATVPEPASRRKSRAWIWVLLLIGLLGGGAAVAWQMGFLKVGGLKKEEKYVVASNLYRRIQPSEEESAKTKSMIPYGSKVVVKARPKTGWVEIDEPGGPTFVSETYLVERKEFLVIDGICSDPDVKQILRESTYKLALWDYFEAKGLKADLRDKEFREAYGVARDASEIWKVEAKPKSSLTNTVLTNLKMVNPRPSKGDLGNLAVLLSNERTHQHRLVVFDFEGKDSKSSGKALGEVDVACTDCRLRKVDFTYVGSLDQWGYEYDEIEEIMHGGREGILLEDKKHKQVILWDRRSNNLNSYDIY